jgi:hypothetical protein
MKAATRLTMSETLAPLWAESLDARLTRQPLLLPSR